MIKRLSFAVVILFLASIANGAEDSVSLQQLLQQVQIGKVADVKTNNEREAKFNEMLADQAKLLSEATQQLNQLESESAALEAQFERNEKLLSEKREARDSQVAILQASLGHLTTAIGDLQLRFKQSIASNQFSNRLDAIASIDEKMRSDAELPSIDDIEQVWVEMVREVTSSADVVTYTASIGAKEDVPVTRVGLFNLLSDGHYLHFDSTTGHISELARQPSGQQQNVAQLENQTSGYAPLAIDPTGPAGGSYLAALVNTPTLAERWKQGKIVGFVITGLGVLGLILALWRWLVLSGIQKKVRTQIDKDDLDLTNPLGRVLSVAKENPLSDTESLELKLGESIIKERPAIEKTLPLIKIISMAAPLLGLLGTVVGMIIVFQAITLFGAGDPKNMAGGISSALVTTVLGLIVAIPMLFLHSLLLAKAKQILHVLELQSAGLLAARAEAKSQGAG